MLETVTYISIHAVMTWKKEVLRNRLQSLWIKYAKATEFGGMISGEHGIGHGKMDYLAESRTSSDEDHGRCQRSL